MADERNWKARYPHYTKDNLHLMDVIHLENEPYLLVYEGHPVVDLLKFNRERLAWGDIEKYFVRHQKYDSRRYMKLTQQVLDVSCQKLIEMITNFDSPSPVPDR
jgi:hypothetical protein